jgi:beta-N-acetylhexosaminidase
MEMQAIAGTYGIERGSVLAIAAGADAICVGGRLADDETVRRLRDALIKAVRTGELPEERLADAAEHVRTLARWTASPQEPFGTRPTDIGLLAARRAVDTTYPAQSAPFEPLREPPYVAAFTPVANFAVGDKTPWGVAAELVRLLPGTRTGTFTGDAAGQAALTEAGPSRIVAVVRDEHRHPWMSAALNTLLTARPDTIVVEMGVPQAPRRGALHLATHGAARVCGQAAAEFIAGE